LAIRIGDLGQSQRLGGFVLQTQGRIRDAQLDIASGTRAQRWDEISDRAGLLEATRDQRVLAERLVAESEKVQGRIQAMDAALAGMGELAERFRTLLVARLGEPGRSAIPLVAEVDQMAAELESLLNRQLDGRYLFAGSRDTTQPVALPDPLPTTADPTLYYQGDAVAPSVRADTTVEIDYGTTAAAEPFAELVAALGQARAAQLADDRAGLEQALATAAGALEGLADERGRVGVAGARLESVVEVHRATIPYLQELESAIADTDVALATTRLARDQANLEATYLVVARLNQLSLADYLR
jgi:flagellar hook-associated protein 3 FlgL